MYISDLTKSSIIEYFEYLIPQDKDLITMGTSARGVAYLST